MNVLRGAAPGPTLLLVAGMHGNEPAGVGVCRRLFESLAARPLPAGEIAAFVANPPALAAGTRYVVCDMNRQWTAAGLAAARAAAAPDAEQSAQIDLAGALDEVIARARGPVFALDLHTTSADGIAFAIVGQAPGERAFAAQLAITGVAGISDRTPGTLAGWLSSRGHVAIAIEGGQHQSETAVANLEAIVTLALAAAGLFAAADLPAWPAARERLLRERGALPPLIEVVSRHEVRLGSGFRMEPGFINIQETAAGTLLARETTGEVRAPFDGFLLLPLYQKLGEDGFFFGRAAGRASA